MLITIFSWLLFGALIGWTASLLSDKRSSLRTIAYTSLGMIISILGGTIITGLMGSSKEELFLTSFVLALPAVIALLGVFEYTSSKQR